MKRATILIVFILISSTIKSQFIAKFDDLIEFSENGQIKLYLDAVHKASYKRCSDYYMIFELKDNYFQFKDTVNVFYKNGKRYISLIYKNGKRHGLYKSFDKKGRIKLIGKYENGRRTGKWQYFHSNGNLYKTIEFKDGRAHLKNLYKRRGKVIVENGEGVFNDKLPLSIADIEKSKIKGRVSKGLPEGEWNIYTGGFNIATEFFEKGDFKRGVSHSVVFGNEAYYDQYLSTFSGIEYIEHLNLFSPSMCGTKSNLSLSSKFYNKLRDKYNSSSLQSKLANCWFLIEIKKDTNNSIESVKVYSKADDEDIETIRRMILEIKELHSYIHSDAKYEVFPIVIKNSNFYLNKDNEIELLKYNY